MFHVKLLTTKERGGIGEKIATEWLSGKGFLVLERNYRKKWGEIDIIAAKDKIIHFIEVKSITGEGDRGHKPEDNVHELKQKRLRRTIQTFLAERKYSAEAVFQFHIVAVYMNDDTRKARVEFIENVIL
jgi:putative endonuclease